MFNLSNLSQRDKALLAALGAILLIFASYLLVVKPKFDQLSKINDDIESERNSLNSDRSHLKRVQELERNFEKTEAMFAKVKKAIPEKTEIPSAVVELSNIYKDENVELLKFAPLPLADETDYSTFQVSLDSSNDLSIYPIIALLRRIESHQRFFRVVSVELKGDELQSKTGGETSGEEAQSADLTLKSTIILKAYTTEKVPPPAQPAKAPTPSTTTQSGQGG